MSPWAATNIVKGIPEKMRDTLQTLDLFVGRVRGRYYSLFGPSNFKTVGRNFRLYGSKHIIGKALRVGDNCWFEAVAHYRGFHYTPQIEIGSGTSFSANVHLSAVKRITIGDDCLFGSNIYVGDHSHGSTREGEINLTIPPSTRPLDDIADILIGSRVWIGDGAVILAGSRIPDGSIVGANSVVRRVFERPSIIAGVPARAIREIK